MLSSLSWKNLLREREKKKKKALCQRDEEGGEHVDGEEQKKGGAEKDEGKRRIWERSADSEEAREGEEGEGDAKDSAGDESDGDSSGHRRTLSRRRAWTGCTYTSCRLPLHTYEKKKMGVVEALRAGEVGGAVQPEKRRRRGRQTEDADDDIHSGEDSEKNNSSDLHRNNVEDGVEATPG